MDRPAPRMFCPLHVRARVRASARRALLWFATVAVALAQESLPPPPPAERFVTFFPSQPPLYGAPLSPPAPSSARINGQPLKTPGELADFVGEIFYPMLGTRLFEGALGKKTAARLAAYAATRATLRNELDAELERTQNDPAPAQAHALQAFARQQTPRVLALEEEAEQIRQELARGGLLTMKIDWDASRDWRLGEAGVAEPPLKLEAEFQVARAAAFFQNGLGVEQRGLLREMAADLAQNARAARRRAPPTASHLTALFFSPETAGLRWPTPLPPALTTKIGRYNGEKFALKRELLDALHEVDRLSEAKRARRFTALSEQQGPRIAELELLAEDIRAAFAALPDAPPPWLPKLSHDLRQSMERYSADRSKIIGELDAALNEARNQIVRQSVSTFGLPPDQRDRALRERTQRAVDDRAKISAAFQERHADRIAELTQRHAKIRAGLTAAARDLTDPKTGQPLTVDALLTAHKLANQHFDAIGREEALYRRYKIAMLQPGLSPAQRRLLFVAAHAGLAQPLPGGEVSTSPATRPFTRSGG